MSPRRGHSGFTRCVLSVAVVAHIWFQLVCHGQNLTNIESEKANDTGASEIDYATLSLFGVSHEFADLFRINFLKAIEAAKDEVDPLRQGEFGGVNGGSFQQGGGSAGGGATEEEDEDEEVPTTAGPGPFGVLSGIFGIFSGLGTLNPTRIIQSTVNFFPPSQRMQAQMIVDSLIGYIPPENRTARPRTRRPPTTTPMTITDAMMKEVMGNQTAMKTNETAVVSKDGEEAGAANSTIVELMSESEDLVPKDPETTTFPGFINVHELLHRSTTPEPRQNEDDESDDHSKRASTTDKPKSMSALALYKVRVKSPEQVVERGVMEETATANLNTTSDTTPIPPSVASSESVLAASLTETPLEESSSLDPVLVATSSALPPSSSSEATLVATSSELPLPPTNVTAPSI